MPLGSLPVPNRTGTLSASGLIRSLRLAMAGWNPDSLVSS